MTLLMYLCPQDFPDGRFKLQGVVVVHRHDMRSADILLCIRVLGGHLRKDTLELWLEAAMPR